MFCEKINADIHVCQKIRIFTQKTLPSMEANIDLPNQALNSATEFDNNRLDLVVNNVEISAFVTRTLVGLARTQEQKLLSNDQAIKIANFFIFKANQNESPLDYAYAVQALAALNIDPSSLSKPVSFVKSGSFPKYNFKMISVFGDMVDSARFFLNVEGQKGQQVQDLEVKATGDVDLSSLELEPGFYSAEISISGAASYAGIMEKTLNFRFGVTRSESSYKIKSKSLSAIKKGEVESVKVSTLKSPLKSGDKLQVKFDLVDTTSNKIFEVQQAFVRFYNEESGLEGFSVAKFKVGAGYSVTLQMSASSDFKNVLSNQEGKWSVEAILGDNSLPKPINIDLGSFEIDMAGQVLSSPEPGSVLNLKDTASVNYSPERLIEHTFREPDARPPSVISLAFTGITLAPLLILFIMWPLYGLNFKLFQFSISSLIFHVSFTGTLLLYVLYWLKLNMFQTINYLIVLSFLMVFSGHRLLTGLAKSRRNEASEKSKKIN